MHNVFSHTDCGGDGDTLRVFQSDRDGCLFFEVNESSGVIIKPEQAHDLMGVLISFTDKHDD